MQFADWITALQKGVTFIEGVLPMAALGGPQAAAVAGVISAVAGVVDQALAHANDAANLVSAKDLATVRAIQKTVQDAGDALAALVDAS